MFLATSNSNAGLLLQMLQMYGAHDYPVGIGVETTGSTMRPRSQQKRRRLMRQCNSTHGKSGRW